MERLRSKRQCVQPRVECAARGDDASSAPMDVDGTHADAPDAPVYLSKYEAAQIIAMRAAMLYDDATPLVPLLSDRDDLVRVATRELLDGHLSFVVHRPTGNGAVSVVDAARARLPRDVRAHYAASLP
jgi:DNA-directed RNA polymerase subunit K/omega